MYRVIIQLKKDISEETLNILTENIIKAFDNRIGKAEQIRTDSAYRFELVGDEDMFSCLQLGLLSLGDNKLFMASVEVWEWSDDDEPDENENLIEIYSKPIK